MMNKSGKIGGLTAEQLREISELFDSVERGELKSESGLVVSPRLASVLSQEKMDDIIAGVALELNMTSAQVVERFKKVLLEKARQKIN